MRLRKILLLLLPALLLALGAAHATATTIVVPDDYPTIQQAIGASSVGDTVYVRVGTYYEHLTIDRSLTLEGEDRDATVIDGSGSGNVVYVSVDYVTIDGLTVANGENGILLINDYTIDHFTVRNTVITGNFGTGVSAPHSNSSSYHTIEGCIFSYNGGMFYGHQFGYSVIRDCEFFGNTGGLSVGWGSYTTICDNTFHGNSGTCIWIDSGTYNIVERNVVDGNGGSGIGVGYVGNSNTIRENVIRNNGTGISMGGPSVHSNMIYHNTLVGNVTQAYDAEGDNSWDDGYPSGGNYWSDYVGEDQYSGPNQDIPGPDGIGDTPYWVTGAGADDYPLLENPSPVQATSWTLIKARFR